MWRLVVPTYVGNMFVEAITNGTTVIDSSASLTVIPM